MNKKDLIALTIITALLVGIISSYFTFKKEIRRQTSLYESVSDTLKVFKNKNGEYVAKILAIEVEREKDFITIKNLFGINKELQDLVIRKSKEVKDLQVALIHKSETIIEHRDTVYFPDPETALVIKDLVLMTSFNNKWIDAKYGIDKGFYKLDLRVYNDFEVTIGYEKTGLFKPSKSYVEVVDKNPYTIPTDLKAYRKIVPQKRWHINAFGGFGGQYGLINKQIDFGPQVGIGVGYNIF